MMALPLPERWRAPVGVMAAMPRRVKTPGFAMLEPARDLPDATLISRVYLQRGRRVDVMGAEAQPRYLFVTLYGIA